MFGTSDLERELEMSDGDAVSDEDQEPYYRLTTDDQDLYTIIELTPREELKYTGNDLLGPEEGVETGFMDDGGLLKFPTMEDAEDYLKENFSPDEIDPNFVS